MISDFMRILLIVGAACNLCYIIMKLRKVQIEVGEAVFWIWISLIIALLGFSPEIPITIALWCGVDSPVNLVYLFFIALLIVKVFLVSLKVARLETQLKELITKLAVSEKLKEQEKRD